MPRYLIAFNDEWVPPHTPEEITAKAVAVDAVVRDMRSAGVFLFGEGGIDASTALCSVVAKEGRPVFSDGPYAETKEHLGGFTVIEVPDDQAARDWAGRVAVALDWPQQVHRFPPPPPEATAAFEGDASGSSSSAGSAGSSCSAGSAGGDAAKGA